MGHGGGAWARRGFPFFLVPRLRVSSSSSIQSPLRVVRTGGSARDARAAVGGAVPRGTFRTQDALVAGRAAHRRRRGVDEAHVRSLRENRTHAARSTVDRGGRTDPAQRGTLGTTQTHTRRCSLRPSIPDHVGGRRPRSAVASDVASHGRSSPSRRAGRPVLAPTYQARELLELSRRDKPLDGEGGERVVGPPGVRLQDDGHRSLRRCRSRATPVPQPVGTGSGLRTGHANAHKSEASAEKGGSSRRGGRRRRAGVARRRGRSGNAERGTTSTVCLAFHRIHECARHWVSASGTDKVSSRPSFSVQPAEPTDTLCTTRSH